MLALASLEDNSLIIDGKRSSLFCITLIDEEKNVLQNLTPCRKREKMSLRLKKFVSEFEEKNED
jgi:hypothetical protein